MNSRRRFRVLHLVAIRGKGGTGASTAALIEGLASRGHRVSLVCFTRSDLYRRVSKETRIQVVIGIYMSPLRRINRLFSDLVKLVRVVREQRIEIVHTHSSPDTWLGFLLALLCPRLSLVRSRHVPVPLSANPFNGVIHRWTKAVVAVSHGVKRSYLQGKCWEDKVTVIHDGVDTERFSPGENGGPFRVEIGLKEGLLIANISRYAPVKGLQIFLEGVAPVLRRHSNARAVIVGRKRDELLPMLERHAEVLGVKGQVLFLEHRTDTPQIVAASDLVVLTSVGSEGSSRVSVETHSGGRPMVGTQVGAIAEVINHKETGLMIPPYHPPALTSSLQVLLENRRLSRRMGALARRRACSTMEIQRTVDRVEDLYREILHDG